MMATQIGNIGGIEVVEAERNGNMGLCCGAGGARMWMEERIGSRINLTRTDMALETGASTIAVARLLRLLVHLREIAWRRRFRCRSRRPCLTSMVDSR